MYVHTYTYMYMHNIIEISFFILHDYTCIMHAYNGTYMYIHMYMYMCMMYIYVHVHVHDVLDTY